MKTNFENVLFTDESRATLDGPDGWMIAWLLNGATPQSKIRQQQGGRGVMIWAGIINNQIVDPFRVPNVVKICAKSYVDCLKKFPFLVQETTTSIKEEGDLHARQCPFPRSSLHSRRVNLIWV